MEPEALAFLTLYTRFVRNWYYLAAAAIIGGILGWGFSFIQRPVYDAKTSIEVTVDFSQTGNISPYNFDLSVGTIQGVFLSKEVLSLVSARYAESFSPDQEVEIRGMVGMERRGTTWVLRVRNNDPDVAAYLVNTWLEIGYEGLVQARNHSQTAKLLQRYLDTLENCPPPPVVIPPVPSICLESSTVDDTAVKTIQDRIKEELENGHAIQPYLIFSQHSPAEVPDEPVMYQTKWLVIGGMLSFFGIAVLAMTFYKPKIRPGS